MAIQRFLRVSICAFSLVCCLRRFKLALRACLRRSFRSSLPGFPAPLLLIFASFAPLRRRCRCVLAPPFSIGQGAQSPGIGISSEEMCHSVRRTALRPVQPIKAVPHGSTLCCNSVWQVHGQAWRLGERANITERKWFRKHQSAARYTLVSTAGSSL